MLNEAKHTSEERLVVALGDQNDTKILSVPAYQPGTDQRSGDRIFRHNEWSFTPNSGRTFASSLECIFPAAWYLNELLPIYQYWRDDQPEEVDCIDSFLALLASCDNLHVGLSAFTTFHSTNSFLTAHQVLLSIQHLGYVKILKYVLCSCIYSVVHCVGSVVFVPFCMPSSSDGWNWYWESDSQNLNHSVIISVSVYSVVLLFNPVSKTYFRNGRHLFSNAWWMLSHLLHLHHQAHHHSSNLYLKCESSSDSDCDATTVGGLQPYMYEPAADSSAPCTTPTAVGFTSNIVCPTKKLVVQRNNVHYANSLWVCDSRHLRSRAYNWKADEARAAVGRFELRKDYAYKNACSALHNTCRKSCGMLNECVSTSKDYHHRARCPYPHRQSV